MKNIRNKQVVKLTVKDLKKALRNIDGDKELDGEEVCDLLNNYEKENEQLKSTNMEYEDALGRLEEENEQLKKENKDLKSNIDYFNRTYEIEERGLNCVPSMCTIMSPTPSRRELCKENEQLKSEYKVLHTQYQDLKKFVENNFDEYLTQEKLNRQIIKLSDEKEQLKDILKNIIIQLNANHTMNTYQMVIPINRVIYNELNRKLKETSFNEELRRFLDD